MPELAEVLFTQPEERGAVELGVAADPVIGVGVQLGAVPSPPLFPGLVATLDIDGAGAPVVRLPGDVVAPLQDQDLLARRRQPVSQRATAGAGTDHDNVEMHGEDPWILREQTA